jgi:hypothetical protein
MRRFSLALGVALSLVSVDTAFGQMQGLSPSGRPNWGPADDSSTYENPIYQPRSRGDRSRGKANPERRKKGKAPSNPKDLHQDQKIQKQPLELGQNQLELNNSKPAQNRQMERLQARLTYLQQRKDAGYRTTLNAEPIDDKIQAIQSMVEKLR